MHRWSTWPFGMGVVDSWIFIILKFIFIGLVLGIIIVLLRWFLNLGDKEIYKDPLDILKQRLAKGEIDIEEYENLKKKIKDT